MAWTHCRYCTRALAPRLQELGFCTTMERQMHREEKDRTMKAAREAFEREGEPNGGYRA